MCIFIEEVAAHSLPFTSTLEACSGRTTDRTCFALKTSLWLRDACPANQNFNTKAQTLCAFCIKATHPLHTVFPSKFAE